ncbi:hypothetical protein ABK040_016374 [Willaertia magna]
MYKKIDHKNKNEFPPLGTPVKEKKVTTLKQNQPKKRVVEPQKMIEERGWNVNKTECVTTSPPDKEIFPTLKEASTMPISVTEPPELAINLFKEECVYYKTNELGETSIEAFFKWLIEKYGLDSSLLPEKDTLEPDLVYLMGNMCMKKYLFIEAKNCFTNAIALSKDKGFKDCDVLVKQCLKLQQKEVLKRKLNNPKPKLSRLELCSEPLSFKDEKYEVVSTMFSSGDSFLRNTYDSDDDPLDHFLQRKRQMYYNKRIKAFLKNQRKRKLKTITTLSNDTIKKSCLQELLESADVCLELFTFLPVKDLFHLMLTCNAFNELIRDSRLLLPFALEIGLKFTFKKTFFYRQNDYLNSFISIYNQFENEINYNKIVKYIQKFTKLEPSILSLWLKKLPTNIRTSLMKREEFIHYLFNSSKKVLESLYKDSTLRKELSVNMILQSLQLGHFKFFKNCVKLYPSYLLLRHLDLKCVAEILTQESQVEIIDCCKKKLGNLFEMEIHKIQKF